MGLLPLETSRFESHRKKMKKREFSFHFGCQHYAFDYDVKRNSIHRDALTEFFSSLLSASSAPRGLSQRIRFWKMCFFFSLWGAWCDCASFRMHGSRESVRCFGVGAILDLLSRISHRAHSRRRRAGPAHYAVIVQCFMAVLCCALLSEPAPRSQSRCSLAADTKLTAPATAVDCVFSVICPFSIQGEQWKLPGSPIKLYQHKCSNEQFIIWLIATYKLDHIEIVRH